MTEQGSEGCRIMWYSMAGQGMEGWDIYGIVWQAGRAGKGGVLCGIVWQGRAGKGGVLCDITWQGRVWYYMV